MTSKPVLIAILLSLLFCLTSILVGRVYLNDDAVISYRFTWNLVRGYGLASYPGGPPVEGYSNPLLVLGTALVCWILGIENLGAIFQVGVLLNTLAALGIIFLLLKWSREIFGSKWYACLPSFLLVIFHPFPYERGSGLETLLYTCFVLCMVYGFSRGKLVLGTAGATLATLTRVEGIGLAVLSILLVLFRERRDRARLVHALRVIAVGFILPVAVFFAWRFLYFGRLLPVTATVKTRLAERGAWSGSGFRYIARGILSSPLLIVLSSLTAWRLKRRQNRRACFFESLVILAQLAFIVAVGGDDFHFGLHRFLFPVMPFLFLSIGELMAAVRQRWIQTIIVLIAVCFALVFTNFQERRWYFAWEKPFRDFLLDPVNAWISRVQITLHPSPWIDALAGEFAASLVPDGGRGLSLASCQAGSLPIHWKGAFHDLIGLLSPEYAAVPRDQKDEVFRKNPPDILLAFRWQRGWFRIPSARLLQELGYKPVALIRLIETMYAHGQNLDFVVNFMVFVRDPSILVNFNRVSWSYESPVAYSDGTAQFEDTVRVREFVIRKGI